MFAKSKAFSGFSSDDLPAAKAFYGDVLGLDVSEQEGMLDLELVGGGSVIIYPKPNHQPSTYTVLNFPVADIEAAVTELTAHGVHCEQYEGMAQDERGIHRGDGPPIAWFTDPAGNILSVIEMA